QGDQGIAEVDVMLEEVGLSRELQRDTERAEKFGPALLPGVFLLDIGDEQPSKDAHGRAKDGDLGGQRGEDRDQGQCERAGERGTDELEIPEDRLRAGEFWWVAHASDLHQTPGPVQAVR